MSINTIKSLRDDFYEGWKTWDGSDFSGLRNSSQSSGREEKAKADFIFPPSTPAYSRSESVVRPQPNKAKPRSRKRVLEDDYDTLEHEWTAAKTVSEHDKTPVFAIRRIIMSKTGFTVVVDANTKLPPPSQFEPAGRPPNPSPRPSAKVIGVDLERTKVTIYARLVFPNYPSNLLLTPDSRQQ